MHAQPRPETSSAVLIRGGRVIDPASGADHAADVLIRNGRVEAIGPDLDAPGAEVLDATGCLVTPGLIDPHVHLREPGFTHKEDIASGTGAAVAGGFTTVCCMPNTRPTIDVPEVVCWITDRAAATGCCRVFCVSAGTLGRKGVELADIDGCVAAGSVGISDDGDAIADPDIMQRVLERCAEHDRVFMQHCQDPAMTAGSVMHEGRVSRRLGLTGWPREAEETIVARDIDLARQTGARYHIQHISSAGTVELIRQARSEGLAVSGEASPHHLLLTDEAIERLGSAAKMNPPLREWPDVLALREGVADGTVTVLATDHAPHATDEKRNPMASAPFGIIGLETALALYAEALVHNGLIGWDRLIALMTIEPARLCNLDQQGLGSLTVGGPGDVTVIDPEREWVISPDDLKGKSVNTPFLGRAVRGRAVATVVGGRVAFRLEREAAVV
ncbi:MAG: dihydroorotase [Phycisphaerales bacterium]|nr:dihydroorotase [Planctomycetota bacterium]MCH8507675.1 dihydroorotase [Phycisphaerales bacterium]